VSDPVRDWFQRKLAGGVGQFRGIITVAHECNTVVGPRSIFARVKLSLCSNDSFVFESRVRWPEENYDRWVLDGVLDALFGVDNKPPLGVRVVLLEAGWDPVNSAPIAYYRAAKIAVRSALAGGDGQG
jgi:hypothetical protein